METTAGFDAVAVMRRLVSTPVRGSNLASVEWTIEATDRVLRLATAIQAEAIHERELLIAFPPLPDPGDPADTAGPQADPSSGMPEPAQPSTDDEPDEEPDEEPLPALGPKPESPASPGEQERLQRRAWLLGELLLIAEAFRAGRIGLEHIDTLATLTFRLDDRVQQRVFDREPDLLTAALTTRVDGFRRMIRRLIDQASDDEGAGRLRDQRARSYLKHWVRGDRMHGIYLELDEERGARFFEALEAEMAAIYASGAGKGLAREQVAIQAFCNLQAHTQKSDVDRSGADAPADQADIESEAPTPTKPKVSTRRRSAPTKGTGLVLIDVTTWLHGLHEASICETASGVPLPPSAIRNLLCQAAIKYGLTINGRVIGGSSKQRLATGDQRLMLRGMYRTCAFPGCTNKFADCEIHHVSFRSKGGHTIIEMMIPLCRQQHHDSVHAHHWRVTIDTERTLTWITPSGEIHDVVPYVPLADLDRLPTTSSPPRPPPPPPPRPKPARTARIPRAPDPPPAARTPTLFDQHSPAA